MPQRNRKSEQIRRANRVIQSRSFILMLVMGVLLFVVLFFKLYQLQIGRHDELQKKAINQQVRSTVVTASRGTIYDASGNILAISSTAETVFLDPNAIDKALSDTEKPVAWDARAERAAARRDSRHQRGQHPREDGAHLLAV